MPDYPRRVTNQAIRLVRWYYEHRKPAKPGGHPARVPDLSEIDVTAGRFLLHVDALKAKDVGWHLTGKLPRKRR
jgi:hypothetical protein